MKNDNSCSLRLVRLAVAGLSLAAAGSAMAQFIDERTPPKPEAAASAPAAEAAAPTDKSAVAPVVVEEAKKVEPPKPTPPDEVVREWRIEAADGNLSRTLRRWGREVQRTVLWEADKDPSPPSATYKGDFLSAIAQVMNDSWNSGYPLRACAYWNVVRVIHATQSCNR